MAQDKTIKAACIGGGFVIVGAILTAMLTNFLGAATPSVHSPSNSNAPSPKTAISAGASSSSASLQAGKPSVYWSGPVGFSVAGSGLDFDTRPPSSGDQTYIYYGGNELQASANAQVSRWTQSGTPSESQCATWVTTHPSTAVIFPAGGMQICIKTDQGRYGRLHIESSSNQEVSAIATIWNL